MHVPIIKQFSRPIENDHTDIQISNIQNDIPWTWWHESQEKVIWINKKVFTFLERVQGLECHAAHWVVCDAWKYQGITGHIHKASRWLVYFINYLHVIIKKFKSIIFFLFLNSFPWLRPSKKQWIGLLLS